MLASTLTVHKCWGQDTSIYFLPHWEATGRLHDRADISLQPCTESSYLTQEHIEVEVARRYGRKRGGGGKGRRKKEKKTNETNS
jgi:hypothetical protein